MMHGIISNNGCSLSYWVRGTGPILLFIQGVGVQGTGWLPQVDELSNKFKCIWFDNRGMGLSQPAGHHITVEQLADDARAVLLAAGHASAHVIGHSLGGLIAQQFALSHPDLVESLSLLCTFSGGKYVAPLTPRMMWLGMRTQIGTRRMRRLGFLRLVSPPGPIADPDTLAESIGKLFGHDLADQPPVVRLQMKAMRRSDLTAKLKGLAKIPTLIVSGRHDPIATPTAGKRIADEITDSRFVLFNDASHGLPITHADKVNQLISEFIESKIPSGPLA